MILSYQLYIYILLLQCIYFNYNIVVLVEYKFVYKSNLVPPIPCYLSNTIERLQKRVMSIIYPNLSYDDSLALSDISKLSSRREEACIKLFNEIVNIPDHKLAYLLPPKQETKYDLSSGNLVFLRTIYCEHK